MSTKINELKLPLTIMPYHLQTYHLFTLIPRSPEEYVKEYAKEQETGFRSLHLLPQYQYFTRPIYKICVDKIGPVAATAVSFLSADLVIHQLLPQSVTCLTSYLFSDETCNIEWYPIKTALWMGFGALPVMYAKYQKG